MLSKTAEAAVVWNVVLQGIHRVTPAVQDILACAVGLRHPPFGGRADKQIQSPHLDSATLRPLPSMPMRSQQACGFAAACGLKGQGDVRIAPQFLHGRAARAAFVALWPRVGAGRHLQTGFGTHTTARPALWMYFACEYSSQMSLHRLFKKSKQLCYLKQRQPSYFVTPLPQPPPSTRSDKAPFLA